MGINKAKYKAESIIYEEIDSIKFSFPKDINFIDSLKQVLLIKDTF